MILREKIKITYIFLHFRSFCIFSPLRKKTYLVVDMGITEISLVPKRAGGTRLGSRILFPGCGAVFPGHGRLLRVEAVFTGSGAMFPVSENFIRLYFSGYTSFRNKCITRTIIVHRSEDLIYLV